MKLTDKQVSNIKRRYNDMIQRCYNEKCRIYKHYGGRGILVTSEWLGSFGKDRFINWSLDNGYKKELSLDRIDNNKGYSPSNCRWTDRRTQNINKRSGVKSKTGFVGVCITSSSYEGHTYYYGRVKGKNGKHLYTGCSTNLKEAVIMRNNFILENDLDNELNIIPIGME